MQNASSIVPQKVLDTYALVAFFEDEPGANYVRKLLVEAEAGNITLAMCVVNLGEFWYIVARAVSTAQADTLVEEIQGMAIEIVDADWELVQHAARFKVGGGLSYADCFTAALGKIRQAEVITGDPEFNRLTDEIQIRWEN